MIAGDLLRLAWEAEHDGRSKLRDALLTMAVTESSPGDAWAERCRSRLLQDRPDHFLCYFPTVAQALSDSRVLDIRDRLRAKYPPARVDWLLLKANARRGPYLGRVESLEAMIEDLVGLTPVEVENVRLDLAQVSKGPLIRQKIARPVAWSLAYPPLDRSSRLASSDLEPEAPSDSGESNQADADLPLFYATVLLGIAFLIASVEQGQRAA